MTPTQYEEAKKKYRTIGEGLTIKLKEARTTPPDLSVPYCEIPTMTLERATIKKGAALRNHLFERLCSLASSTMTPSGKPLTKSKAAIRLLQLPE